MNWTTDKPTAAGFYWWREDGFEPCVVEIRDRDGFRYLCGLGWVLLSNASGEFLGPLSPDDRQQGKVEGIQESKNLVSEFIEAWLLAGMVAKLLTPAVHEAVGGLSRDLRRELQKIEQAAQDEKGVGDGKDCL